jgi:hypothetical protein
MPANRTDSTPATRGRSGFTALELLLVVIAIPVAILGFIFISVYVPTLVLQSFGYEIDVWFFFSVNAAAGAIGYGYSLLAGSRAEGEDAPVLKRFGRNSIKYLLHSILLMLIFGASGDDIGLVHILVAGLPMLIFWQSVSFAVGRFRGGRKVDESKLIIPESFDKN